MMLWQRKSTSQKRRMKEAQLSQTVVRRLIFVHTVQGVSPQSDTLWSPIWPPKIDMNFFKKVATYSASDRNITKYVSVKIWFFNDPIHKEEPVLDKAKGGCNHQDQEVFWLEKGLVRPLRFLRLPRSMRLHRYLRPGKSQLSSYESTRSLNLLI